MAKRRRSRKSSKCTEPLNSMIDIAGAVTMGLVSRAMVKKDIKKEQGRESVNAARTVYGLGSLRSGSEGLISLGGLMGVESAVRSAEREHQRQHCEIEEDSLIADLERRINATQTIRRSSTTTTQRTPSAPRTQATAGSSAEILASPVNDTVTADADTFIFCRVSRLDNGINDYYLAQHDYVIGSRVQVEKDDGLVEGIILTVEKHSLDTAPVSPDLAKRIVD